LDAAVEHVAARETNLDGQGIVTIILPKAADKASPTGKITHHKPETAILQRLTLEFITSQT